MGDGRYMADPSERTIKKQELILMQDRLEEEEEQESKSQKQGVNENQYIKRAVPETPSIKTKFINLIVL